MRKILDAAKITDIPQASTAVFVGTEFDAITDAEAMTERRRRTAWGEIAFQLGGEKLLRKLLITKNAVAPGGEVIRKFLPENEPCLILLDEIMNYVSRTTEKPADPRNFIISCKIFPKKPEPEKTSYYAFRFRLRLILN